MKSRIGRRLSSLLLISAAFLLIFVFAGFTRPADAQSEVAPEAAATAEVTAVPDADAAPEASDGQEVTATPEAAAAPDSITTSGPLRNQSSDMTLSDAFKSLLNWTPQQWADFLVSILIFALIAIFGWRIVIWIGKAIAGRTGTTIDDQALAASRRPLQWIFVILGFQVAYSRLDFLRSSWQDLFNNLSFVVYTILGSIIVWVFIDAGLDFYKNKASENDADMKAIDRLLPLVRTFLRGLLVIVTVIIILHHFGIEIMGVVAALGLTGFALSLAAKDTLTNIIAGVTIAVNRPFRINDRIYNKDVGGWVDVVEIGLRSTKVLTRDNRMVIIPNSDLSDDTVINYSFPNHNYRLQVDIGVAYGTDIDTARQVFHDAVSQVEGVMANKPVQVLFVEFAESTMIFRVRWWIPDYVDMRKMNDRVYQAIQEALDAHGIVSPGPILDVNTHLDQQDADRLAGAFQAGPSAESSST